MNGDQLNGAWNAEWHCSLIFQGEFHEVCNNRGRQFTTSAPFAHRFRIIITNINAHSQVRREAYKPSIPLIIGCSSFASHWFAKDLHFLSCAALNNAFHHRSDLIGGIRAHHLLAIVNQLRLRRCCIVFLLFTARAFAVVMTIDCVSITILNAVDQCCIKLPAAIGDHTIGGRHL